MFKNIDYYNSFQNAFTDIRYALSGKLFQPNLTKIMSILEEFHQGNLLSITEKSDVLDPMREFLKHEFSDESFRPNQLKFRRMLESPEPKQIPIRTFLLEVIEALLQKHNQPQDDLLAFQAVINAFDRMVTDTKIDEFMTCKRSLFARWSIDGPYTYAPPKEKVPPIFQERLITIVRLPVALRYDGFLAWACISHEIAGHHFLSSFPDSLFKKIKKTVFDTLEETKVIDENYRNILADYWSECGLELACDVLGVWNLGPAFAIGFTGYLLGTSNELETTGLLHSKKMERRRVLELKFPIETFLITDLHPNIQISSKSGVLGNLTLNEKKSPIHFTRKIIPSVKYPLSILRILVIKTFILKLIKTYPGTEKATLENLALSILEEATKNITEMKELEFKTPPDKVAQNSDEEPEVTRIPTHYVINSAEIAAQAVESALEGWFLKKKCRISDLIAWKISDSELVEYLKKFLMDDTVNEIPHIPTDRFPHILPNHQIIRHILAASVLIAVSEPEVSRQYLFNKMKHWVVDAEKKAVYKGMQEPNPYE